MLTADELKSLLVTVFKPRPADKVLTVIVDVPDDNRPDNKEWRERRRMAFDWHRKADSVKADLGLETVRLLYYQNVGSNNNDLHSTFYYYDGDPENVVAKNLLERGAPVSLEDVFTETDWIIAPTELSATAPCKMLAKKYNFRGTTMPGFTLEMLPSLSLDYAAVHKRIMALKERLDRAEMEEIVLVARGERYKFCADLRFRTATPSSGMFHDDMVVGNLPSGETYIVPYEGEKAGEVSMSAGKIPVQFGDEIVVYEIHGNRAIRVLTDGPVSEEEAGKLADEPAYGNIAEIGHGVLGEFGLKAAGNLLMDEKLGLHIAFGRSEHFGGIVSPASFRNPKNVIHIDRVYVPSLQPDITVDRVTLSYEDGTKERIMEKGLWVV